MAGQHVPKGQVHRSGALSRNDHADGHLLWALGVSRCSRRERYCGFIYRWSLDGKNHDRLGDKYPKYVKWA